MASAEAMDAPTAIAPSAEEVAPTVKEQEKKKKKEKSVGSRDRSADLMDGAQSLLTVVVLALCCVLSFSSRLFAVIRFESIIHEFDPW